MIRDIVSAMLTLTTMKLPEPVLQAIATLDLVNDGRSGLHTYVPVFQLIGNVAFDQQLDIHNAMEQADTDTYLALQPNHEALWHIQDACSCTISYLHRALPADPAELLYDEGAVGHIMSALRLLRPRIDLRNRHADVSLEPTSPVHPAIACGYCHRDMHYTPRGLLCPVCEPNGLLQAIETTPEHWSDYGPNGN